MISTDHPTGGFTLATIQLLADRDIVLLTHRTRAAAVELGLDAGGVRSLSAATYEAGRQLIGRAGMEAELRLADGPSLQVVFRIPVTSAEDCARLRQRVRRIVRPLRPLVHEVHVSPRDTVLLLCLRALLSNATVETPPDVPADAVEHAERQIDDVSDAEVRQKYGELTQAFRQLQQELQETNRGVVALYAELETNADKLKHAEDRLRLLLDSVQDYAICMLTPQGDVASWNAGAERLFGYTADEIIGRPFARFYRATDQDTGVPAEHLHAAEQLGRSAEECVRVRKGSAPFDAHVVLTPVRHRRELRGFSLVVRDITERKKLENDLRRRAEDLAAANRAKEDFLATLSHELRTPLNAMLGWTRLLRLGKLDATATTRALDTIERNAQIQEQLIADLLEVSRIVTGKMRLDLKQIALAPTVSAAIDSVRPAAAAKGVLLNEEAVFEGMVLADADRLQQVVWNLLANAIKFTPPGGSVKIHVGRTISHAVITVSDTGEGIAPGFLPFAFDRFMQADTSITRPHGGLGLGLSIVRHIVELHGGKVEARSAGLGLGATFSVSLPLQASGDGANIPEGSAGQ